MASQTSESFALSFCNFCKWLACPCSAIVYYGREEEENSLSLKVINIIPGRATQSEMEKKAHYLEIVLDAVPGHPLHSNIKCTSRLGKSIAETLHHALHTFSFLLWHVANLHLQVAL